MSEPHTELSERLLAACDPGIRATVRLLREHGFETTDSGDGVSKPAAGRVLDVPHVFCVTAADASLFAEARRMKEVLGEPWHVEATYAPVDGTAVLAALDYSGASLRQGADALSATPQEPPTNGLPEFLREQFKSLAPGQEFQGVRDGYQLAIRDVWEFMKQATSPPTATVAKDAQEEVDVAATQLLIELAFLVPKGTDLRTHPFSAALKRYKAAIEARSEWVADENTRLRCVCAEAYQMAGALDAPVRALDNLSAAAAGRPLPHATFLPIADAGTAATAAETDLESVLRVVVEQLMLDVRTGSLANARTAATNVIAEIDRHLAGVQP